MKQVEFTIQDKLRGLPLTFKTTYGLFSYKKIDDGTKLLINLIEVENGQTCLDLGCGYGVVGIVMAKLNPEGKVYFVDRDFVAVDFSKANCKLNNIQNYQALLSDGLSKLDGIKFDQIASNLPSHISHEMLRWLFKDVQQHLNKDGKFYVVTVSKLKRFLRQEFEAIFHNYKQISSDNMYTVSLATT